MVERELFLKALDIADPAARAAFLDRECTGNLDLRRSIEALLAADAHAGQFLDQPHPAAGHSGVLQTGDYRGSMGDETALPLGTLVAGRYKLLQVIGEGGMGSVYMADQIEPVKRRAAVKLIRSGMDSKGVLARFEAERQALALMDHPNIAKILDGGIIGADAAGAAGRPFFVMELVKGVPINEFCDIHTLTIGERLNLFIQVCSAVQHAHQKGIIHRDLKPSNILVESHDGKPVPKVIDFGLAKALSGQPLTEHTLFTALGTVAGTPLYMAPEQAAFNALDVDTRADIYSLGVLLYELLTGTTPIERETLKKAAFDEILRVIRENEPPVPSSRLSSSQTKASVAACRKIEPAKLGRFVKGDLDWIVMKALDKDRNRRYETANGFARDVERFLHHEPVVAGPPTAAYKLRKFVRRNKGPVVAVSVVTIALVAGLIGTTWQWRRAVDAEKTAIKERDDKQLALQAEEKERQRAVTAEGETKKRADELQKVSDFHAQLLWEVDPTQAGKKLTDDVLAKFEAALVKDGLPEAERPQRIQAFSGQWKHVNATDAARAVIDRTILKPAVAAIDKDFADQPALDATLRQVLAARYRDFGMYDSAMPLQERALATRRRVLGEEHEHTLNSLNEMGMLLDSRGMFADAETYHRESLEKNRRVRGEEHTETLISMGNLGMTLVNQGKLSEAEPLTRETLEKSRRVLGEEHHHTLGAITNMGAVLSAQDKIKECEPYYREALEKTRRVRGEEHLETLIAINNLGSVLKDLGRVSEAEAYYYESLAKHRRVLGEEHPNTVIAINNMGDLLQRQGKLEEAAPYYREAMEKARKVWGENHLNTMGFIGNVGHILHAQRKLDEAEPYYRDALEKKRRFLGEDHPSTLVSMNNMATLLRDQGKLEEAIVLSEQAAVGIEKRRFQHQSAGNVLSITINCYERLRQFEKAEAWRRKWLAVVKERAGDQSMAYIGEVAGLGENLLKQKKYADAETFFRESQSFRESKQPDAWSTFAAKTMLGECLLEQNKLAEAEPLLVSGYEGMKARQDKMLPASRQRFLPRTLERLVQLYEAMDKKDQAAKWRTELENRRAADIPPSKP